MSLSIVPAALYVAYRLASAGRAGGWPWLKARAAWFLGFAALTVPMLLIVFACQLWSMWRGYSTPRPLAEFERYGAPAWSYLTPTLLHRLGRWLIPFHPYKRFGWGIIEQASYLGVVTLALVAYAAAFRVRFEHRGFWWALLAALVVLSLGAHIEVGGVRIPLPALWLKKYVVAFKLIRVPARFNLFVAVAAAIIAAAGLRHLLGRLPGRSSRALLCLALAVVVVADLSLPALTAKVPALPPCYRAIAERNPRARLLEIPQWSGAGSSFYSVCQYWQTQHRLRTNASTSGHSNRIYDNLLTWNSPFAAQAMAAPDYLQATHGLVYDIAFNVDFMDYAWLYVNTHGFDYIVLHQWPGAMVDLSNPVHVDTLKRLFESAKIYEDASNVVYDCSRLPAPRKPAILTAEGWRLAWDGRPMRVVERVGQLIVFNPDAGRELRLAIDAKSLHRKRTLRLKAGDRVLATWEIRSNEFAIYSTAPLHLPAGRIMLTVEADGASRPKRPGEAATEVDSRPYSFKIQGLMAVQEPGPEALTRRDGGVQR